MLPRRALATKAVLLSFTSILSGCSLKSSDVAQSLHLDLTKLSSVRSTSRVLTSSTGTTYVCLGVSVTGLDIGDSPGLQCGHPGVVAGPLDPSLSAVDLMIPAGPGRKVTVFGIEDPSLCATFDARSLHAAKSIGSSPVFDFFDDASVSVKLDFNDALAFPDCNPSSNTASTFTSFNLNNALLNNPTSVAVDSAQGYLYIANYADGSISKFTLSTGALIGSIGYVSSSIGTCASGAVTTGWCTGGTFTSGSLTDPSDGRLGHPNGIALSGDGSNLYVADSTNHRVVKFSATTGSFLGWMGGVAATPTGGAVGCSSVTAGYATPGWCIGGRSSSGNQDGIFNSPNGIAVDSSGNIYVVDTGNKRISKYNATGAFQGWIGNVGGISPTSGASGCSITSTGNFTPGWCLGGISDGGSGDGMMSNPQSIAIDSSGNLYVADSLNNRINKYTSAGGFVGWIGNVSTSPTGGAAGCNSVAPGTATPGWCTGGSAASGAGDGMFSLPYALSIDSGGNLFIVDRSNNRISQYDPLGAYRGSIGKIATSPTGGATGCNGAAVGSITPGWCTGGSYTSGTPAGAFTNPSSVAVDSSGHLYVVDLNRLQRLF